MWLRNGSGLQVGISLDTCPRHRPVRRNPPDSISIVWQLTKAEEKATGTPESWKDECSANSAPSGGAPDLFERTSNLIRSQRAYLFS